MTTAKDILVKPIKSSAAIPFVKEHHYSGKVAQNSQLHLGVFLDGYLHGVMQFGPSLDKRKIQGLVSGTQWHEFLELNRMAFDDVLPRNSESRALSIAFRMIKKNVPQVKWIISFADGTQCGDGTIYRAAGFILTGINENKNLARLSDGTVIHKMTLESNPLSSDYGSVNQGKNDFSHYLDVKGGERLSGFQLRYIYFIDKSYRERLTVPELPFSTIDKMGARMYKGERLIGGQGETDNAAQSNAQIEGASPICPLLDLDGDSNA